MRNRLYMLMALLMAACSVPTLTSAVLSISRHHAMEQTVPAVRFPREQALTRSEAILPALMAGSTTLTSELSLNRSYRVSGRETPTWILHSSDLESGRNASIVWNADTGALLHVSQWKNRVPVLPSNVATSRDSAIALALDWFHAMPIRHEHESWHVVGTMQRQRSPQWNVRFQCGDRIANFTVNTFTGQLVLMDCAALSDSKS